MRCSALQPQLVQQFAHSQNADSQDVANSTICIDYYQ